MAGSDVTFQRRPCSDAGGAAPHGLAFPAFGTFLDALSEPPTQVSRPLVHPTFCATGAEGGPNRAKGYQSHCRILHDSFGRLANTYRTTSNQGDLMAAHKLCKMGSTVYPDEVGSRWSTGRQLHKQTLR